MDLKEVELASLHRTEHRQSHTWRDTVDGNLLVGELLGYTTREVLHRGFTSGIRGVESGKRSEKSCYDRHDRSTLLDMFRALFKKEKCSLGVDSALQSDYICVKSYPWD